MRVLIEVVADDREQAVTLLRGAVQAVRWSKERSGQQESSCLGDFRITVVEEEDPEIPYVKGDAVRVSLAAVMLPLDALAPLTFPLDDRGGQRAEVKHSGPGYTGVVFADGHERIVRNEDLEPWSYVEALKQVTEQVTEQATERTLGRVPLRFAAGDRVRLLRNYPEGDGVVAQVQVLPKDIEVAVPLGAVGRIETYDPRDAAMDCLVVWETPRDCHGAWSWLSSSMLDIVPVSPPSASSSTSAKPTCPTHGCEQDAGHAPPCDAVDPEQPCVICGKPSRKGSKHCGTPCAKERVRRLNEAAQQTCPCGDPSCPTGPECFGGSDYPDVPYLASVTSKKEEEP